MRSLVSQQEEPALVEVFADGETMQAAGAEESVHDSYAVLGVDSIVGAPDGAADAVPLNAKAVDAIDVADAEPSEGVPTADARVEEALTFEQRPAETDEIRYFKTLHSWILHENETII